MPAYTVVGQLRNLFADEDLSFGDFTLKSSAAVGWERVCDLFGPANVRRDDWFYIRTYEEAQKVPPQHRGSMVLDFEDTVFLLRLFRIGELGVVAVAIETDDGSGSTRLMWNRSMSPDDGYPEYELNDDDVPAWKDFAAQVMNGAGFHAEWFKTARRFFTYGAATPLELHWGEVDRYVDFCTALEALLVPEDDRVGIRLRRRASKLLMHDGDSAKTTERLLKEFYNARSAVVHGRELGDAMKAMLKEQHLQFEQLVRDLMTAASSLSQADEEHVSALVALYDLTSKEKIDLLVQSFKSLSLDERQEALPRLGAPLSCRWCVALRKIWSRRRGKDA